MSSMQQHFYMQTEAGVVGAAAEGRHQARRYVQQISTTPTLEALTQYARALCGTEYAGRTDNRIIFMSYFLPAFLSTALDALSTQKRPQHEHPHPLSA